MTHVRVDWVSLTTGHLVEHEIRRWQSSSMVQYLPPTLLHASWQTMVYRLSPSRLLQQPQVPQQVVALRWQCLKMAGPD